MDPKLPNQTSTPVPPVPNVSNTSNPQPPTPPAPPPKKSLLTPPLIIGGIVFSVIILGLIITGMMFLKKEERKPVPKQLPQENTALTSISGTLGINGSPPQGSTVNVMAAESGESQFTTVVTGLTPSEGAKWVWTTSTPGTLYQMKAQIISGGQVVGESDPVFIASPATDEVLNVTYEPPIPTQQAAQATPTPAPQVLSSISGIFNVNGYVAPGATITINARQVGSQTFTPIVTGVAPADQSTWSWTNAVQNATYEIQAVLAGASTPVQSQVITVTAPAASEVLTLNSTAPQPSPAVVGVSGTINLNGQIPGGSYITLGARPTGSGAFSQIATNVQATNGVSWSYTAASSGTSYDLQAYLWINNQPASQSQILTVAAPAANEVLTINASTQPAPPASNTISVSCSNNGVGYQANVNVNANSSITNAVQYLITIGSTGGASDVVNNTITPSNPAQSQSYNSPPNLARGQTYYAQFAFSTCVGCTFSSFSPSVPFTCN